MRKLIMWNVISLDGYFEGGKPWDLGFHESVWGDELEKYVLDQLDSAAILVFGRKTYEGMAAYWMKAVNQPEAAAMNRLPKIVCSSTLERAEWSNTTIIRDAEKEIPALLQEGEGNVFVFGSGTVTASLMAASLFDEYRVCIAPVVLGAGAPLFRPGLPYQELTLLHTQPLANGGVILWYGR